MTGKPARSLSELELCKLQRNMAMRDSITARIDAQFGEQLAAVERLEAELSADIVARLGVDPEEYAIDFASGELIPRGGPRLPDPIPSPVDPFDIIRGETKAASPRNVTTAPETPRATPKAKPLKGKVKMRNESARCQGSTVRGGKCSRRVVDASGMCKTHHDQKRIA